MDTHVVIDMDTDTDINMDMADMQTDMDMTGLCIWTLGMDMDNGHGHSDSRNPIVFGGHLFVSFHHSIHNLSGTCLWCLSMKTTFRLT
jgi:hypothetical protein